VSRLLVALLVAGLLLSACGTTSPADAMKKWVSQSAYRANLPTLTGDVRRAANELRKSDATSNDLHTICAVLTLDAEQANSSLPTPDSQATALLAKAYNDIGAGANQCYGAVSASTRASALSWLSRGMAALSEGTARVDVASGQAP
jgi:hypothetical protein